MPLLLSLKLNEMVEAEDALSEANALNNTNAEVWGYLTLICLHVSAQPLPAWWSGGLSGGRGGLSSVHEPEEPV